MHRAPWLAAARSHSAAALLWLHRGLQLGALLGGEDLEDIEGAIKLGVGARQAVLVAGI